MGRSQTTRNAIKALEAVDRLNAGVVPMRALACAALRIFDQTAGALVIAIILWVGS